MTGRALYVDVHKRDGLLAAAAELGVGPAVLVRVLGAEGSEARWVDVRWLLGRPAVLLGRGDRGHHEALPTLPVEVYETRRAWLG